MLERGLVPLYCSIALAGLSFCCAALTVGVTVSSDVLKFAPPLVLILVGGLAARRINLPRVSAALQVFALVPLQSLLAVLLIASMARIGRPFADPILASWDHALGLDWLTFFEWCRPYTTPLRFAYRSFNWQPLLVIGALAYTQRFERLFTWVTAAFLGVLIASAIFALMPAQSPFHYYGITPTNYSERHSSMAWSFLDALNALRAGERHFSTAVLTGMVAFPSYHCVAALLFTWALWPLAWIRWLAVALNLGLISATPIVGNHYFVDIPAGLIVGVISVTSARWMVAKSIGGAAQ